MHFLYFMPYGGKSVSYKRNETKGMININTQDAIIEDKWNMHKL